MVVRAERRTHARGSGVGGRPVAVRLDDPGAARVRRGRGQPVARRLDARTDAGRSGRRAADSDRVVRRPVPVRPAARPRHGGPRRQRRGRVPPVGGQALARNWRSSCSRCCRPAARPRSTAACSRRLWASPRIRRPGPRPDRSAAIWSSTAWSVAPRRRRCSACRAWRWGAGVSCTSPWTARRAPSRGVRVGGQAVLVGRGELFL